MQNSLVQFVNLVLSLKILHQLKFKKLFLKKLYKIYQIYKRICFIILAILIVIGIGSNLESNKNQSEDPNQKNIAQNSEKSNENTENVNNDKKEQEGKIEYTKIDISQMKKDLKDNALKASETYKNKYIEITRNIGNIDSSGKYISLDGPEEDFDLTSILYYIKNDDQKKVVADTTKGQSVTVKGKVTDVGEIMGYSIDINEIIAN